MISPSDRITVWFGAAGDGWIVGDDQDGLAPGGQLLEQVEDDVCRERESRLPVGSSATMIGGSVARARAMAALCCCPLETQAGSLWACSSRPTILSNSRARSRALLDRKNIAVIHRQHGVFQQGQGGQQLEKLENDTHIAPAPKRALAFTHLVDMLSCR